MKIYKESEVVNLMIDLYYKNKVNKDKVEEKEDLKKYCEFRLSKCPFKDNKLFCSNCKIHCYDKTHQDLIKKVMRYSGPRMMIYHPIVTIKHINETMKRKRVEKRTKKKGK